MNLIGVDDVPDALGLGSHELIALVGGGGKTTTLFSLGRALPGRVVLTTTTKMGRDRTEGRPILCRPTMAEVRAIAGPTLVWDSMDEHKAIGVTGETVDSWFDAVDHIVVEADGARRKPFKAPAPYEPVIPSRATTVVAVIGADALDRVIEDQCHRPLRVAALAGCSSYDRLTPERATAVLLSTDGSRKGVAADARFVVVVTKVTDGNSALVARLAAALNGHVERVVTVAFDPLLRAHPAEGD